MQGRAKPDPPGYFEGESMTRRRAFTIAAQGVGGIAGAAIILPAVGFAIAPIFHRGKERWEAVGSGRQLRRRHLPPGRLHRNRGNRRHRQDHRLRPQGLCRTRARIRRKSSRSPTAAPISAVRSALSKRPATSSAPAMAASMNSRASRSAARRCGPLDHFQTRIRKGQVELGPRYSVTNQLEPVRARDPGRVHRRNLGIPLPAAPLHLPPALPLGPRQR